LKKRTRDLPLLLAVSGTLDGQKWALVREMTIGRDRDCDIQIPDRQVSRFHLRITPQENKSVNIRDLESKNGTFINGRKVTGSVTLKDGDQLKVALAQNFIFISSESTIPMVKGRKISGRLLVDAKARRVWILEKEVIPAFSVQQFKLLLCLYERSGEVVPREKIINDVWGNSAGQGITDQALDAMVRRLRERLLQFDKNHEYLITVRGYGIRLDNPEYKEKKSG
jgi:pSer/pThr/pTyr-binding forkhead associated (FHA) protein